MGDASILVGAREAYKVLFYHELDVRNAQETFTHLWLETHMEKNLQIFSLFPDKTCREYGIQQERNIGEAWVGDWKVMKKKQQYFSEMK